MGPIVLFDPTCLTFSKGNERLKSHSGAFCAMRNGNGAVGTHMLFHAAGETMGKQSDEQRFDNGG